MQGDYKKLPSSTHPDINGCQKHFESIHRACSVLSNGTDRDLYKKLGLERAQEELARQSEWND